MPVTLNANSSTGFIATSDTSGVLQLQTGGTTAVTVDASQNVGIGTASPARRLDVRGGTGMQVNEDGAGTKVITLRSDFAGVGPAVNVTTNDPLLLMTNNTERARIDSSGNVGIGTSSPLNKLQIKTQTNGNAGFANSTSVAGGVKISCYNDAGSASSPFEIDGSTLQFNIASVEKMRLDSSGNLLLNTTGYNDGKVVRIDNTDARVRSMIVNNNSAGSSSRCGYIVNANGNSWAMEMGSIAANSNALNWTVDIFGSPTVRMALTTGGAATNSTGSWGTISDIRLKENVVDATPKLDGLMQLRVVNYNLKTDPDAKMLGFVAQEVEQVFPGLVDNDGEATGDSDFYKSVKTTVLVPMLVKAIQEQQAIITQLQADVAALKGASA
jgi:hypothetical protein